VQLISPLFFIDYKTIQTSYSSSPLNGFIVCEKQRTNEVSLMFLYYFYTILYYVIADLSFNIYTIPDEGSAEPKHAVYWHNLRV
jgi:hypothetical protein